MNYITLASTASAKKVGAQSPMKMPKRSAWAFSSVVSPFLMFQIKMEPTIEMKPSAASAIEIKLILKFNNCTTVGKKVFKWNSRQPAGLGLPLLRKGSHWAGCQGLGAGKADWFHRRQRTSEWCFLPRSRTWQLTPSTIVMGNTQMLFP